ncbi:OsmC family protein [Sphingopyxis solisilvae]|uniref:OsmC family protein n=1 Tax=Sphingopyxis solisilvae TaxID=1886788 RepID=UPI001892C487|nr:OsmC family protein [Sphingopyxis solisilvae]
MTNTVPAKQHEYTSEIVWTGNRGEGTKGYRSYDRTWDLAAPGKAVVHCSNDPLLGGDPTLYNPEDMLLSALSACHMLWYLHLAANAGIVVHSYRDQPVGLGETERSGAGRFLEATLRPAIELAAGSDVARADALHHEIHQYCFIARSVAFPVTYAATYSEHAASEGADHA